MTTSGRASPKPSAEAPPTFESGAASPLRFLWLIGLFFVGFLIIVGLNKLFSNLIDELGAQSANERARLFIGEEIVRNIQDIEMDILRMPMAVGPLPQERIEGELLKKVAKLERDLAVLKDGGTIQQLIYLNIEGKDQMVREVAFKPVARETGYVMEIIELGPHLDQVKLKARELKAMLEQRDQYFEQRDGEGLIAISRDILAYSKRLPSFFFRFNENASRLLFDSHQQLRNLETQLSAQRERYKTTETTLIVLVIFSVTLIGILFARQLRESNENLFRAWSEMRLARDDAERASRAKSEFVSRMSHELRTPLNAILGFAQLLDREALTSVQRNYSRQIRAAGQHLLDLIGEVLDLAKIEAGRLVLEHIEFDLRRTMDQVVAVAVKRAQNKGLPVKVVLSSELPGRVRGDPTRLRQVLINLLDNAVKFTERGEVGLRVEPEGEGGKLLFRVWDTGVGMEEQAIRRLFQPFTQADESTTRKYGGTGLGLVICKDLVEAMGGSLQVESHPGQGSRFWFSLPLERVDDAPGSSAAAETSAAAAEGAEGRVAAGRPIPSPALQRHVLLVEDNPVNQLVASSMLAALGASCEIAGNGLEGLEKLEQGTYDLVLMDVEMPQMDGHAATREIRLRERQRESRRVPVIAMTANAMAEDRERCIASGMDDYLAKPYEMDALAAIIRRWLPEAAD